MSRLRRGVRPAIWLAALAALAGAWVATARQPRLIDTAETTVYLVLRTGPDVTEERIIAAIKQGLEKAPATITGEPAIKPVSPAFFEEFQTLVDRASSPAAAAEENVSIRLLPSRDTLYELKLQPTQVLKKLKVTYAKAGVKEYTPAAPGEKSPLVLTVPGRYALTPEPNDVPTAYEGTITELGKPDPAMLKGEWPKGDKYFVVTMRNFRGDKKRLFEVIQDPKQVANPFEYVKLENDLLFAFASLNSGAADVIDETALDSENNLTVTIPTVANRSPKRVWVHFPLDPASAAKLAESLGKLGGRDLPVEVRKNSVPITEPGVLDTADPPKWFELPPEPTAPGIEPRRFTRKLKLNDPAAFGDKNRQLRMLVVWEFDNGMREAIQVKNPKGAPTFVLEREPTGWEKVLPKLAKPKVK